MSIEGIIVNAAGILASLVFGKAMDSSNTEVATSVQIMPGLFSKSDAGSLRGNTPHIALWDDGGNRIGQYHPKEGAAIDGLGDGPDPFSVAHNQNGNQKADAYYAMLSNPGHDAICIAAITIGTKWPATLYGDTGYKCGQSWFPSQNPIGSGRAKPRCVWLDGDHTNKINAQALSFHINDMAPTKDKLAEYQKTPATLCESTPRYSFWGNMEPDSEIPFFVPQLEYLPGSDGNEGADKTPHGVIDKPGQYDKSVYNYIGPGTSATAVNMKPTRRQERPERRPSRKPGSKGTSRGSNHNPEHLIVTAHPHDDVREVCEHPNSYGFDIASTVQNLYCDMENKQLYRICTHPEDDDNCFHMDHKVIIPMGGINGSRELAMVAPSKNYTSVAHWTE